MFDTPVGVIDDTHCFDASRSKRRDYRVFGGGKVDEAVFMLVALPIAVPIPNGLRTPVHAQIIRDRAADTIVGGADESVPCLSKPATANTPLAIEGARFEDGLPSVQGAIGVDATATGLTAGRRGNRTPGIDAWWATSGP
jgi:hypothetical protein